MRHDYGYGIMPFFNDVLRLLTYCVSPKSTNLTKPFHYLWHTIVSRSGTRDRFECLVVHLKYAKYIIMFYRLTVL